jgi:hypothetical protein
VKISRCFAILAFAGAILAFVGLSPSTALADGITDPGVRLKCPGCGSTVLNSSTFFFTVLGGFDETVNTFDFINAVGPTAGELRLTEVISPTNPTPVFPFDLSFICDPSNPFFTNCTPQTLTATNEVRFFGLNADHGGILNAPADTITCGDSCSTTVTLADFAIAVSALDLAKGHNVTIEGVLVAETPEPSAVLLVLVGMVFLFLFRRTGWIPNLNFKL